MARRLDLWIARKNIKIVTAAIGSKKKQQQNPKKCVRNNNRSRDELLCAF